MTKERARTLEPRSGCLVDKVIVEALVKSVGQEMLVKVNINVLQRVPIRSCNAGRMHGCYWWMEASRTQPRILAIK